MTRPGPGCYRVHLQGDRGLVSGPIVDAHDRDEALAKAAVLSKGAQIIDAEFLHPQGWHRANTKLRLDDAKIAWAELVERRGGAVVPLKQRSRAVA